MRNARVHQHGCDIVFGKIIGHLAHINRILFFFSAECRQRLTGQRNQRGIEQFKIRCAHLLVLQSKPRENCTVKNYKVSWVQAVERRIYVSIMEKFRFACDIIKVQLIYVLTWNEKKRVMKRY